MDSDQEKRMAQYLLGQLPLEQQAELEARYLADDTCFEELLAIEDDLRDAYLRGELSRADRQAFEQRLLTLPQQRQKQEFAQALRQHFAQAATTCGLVPDLVTRWKSLLRILEAQPRMVLISALCTTFVILLVGGWWLGRWSTHSSHTVAGTTSRTNGLPGKAPEPQSQTSVPTPGQEAATIAFVLSAGLTRGGEQAPRSLVIPPGVSRVQLKARIQDDYPNYEAVLHTAENRLILSQGNLSAETFPGGKRISLDLPRSLLPPGDYILTIRGLPAAGHPETAAEYAFRVGQK